MLSIGFVSVGKGRYYTGLAREDYWKSGGESPGVWCDNAAARAFGLRGRVDTKHIENLFLGYDPEGLRGLVQNAGKETRRAAIDMTLSVPKTLSALLAVAPEDIRKALEAAIDRAVERTLAFINEQAGYTRIGKGGYEREKVDLLFAKYVHRSSRAQESQYHIHCLGLNLARRADGEFGTIDGKPILDLKKTAGAYFRSALTAELNLDIERDPGAKFAFRVKGVPQELADLWSSRAKEIEAEIRAQGLHGAKAKALVALSTRQVKGHRALEELKQEWVKSAAEHGFTERDASEIFQGRLRELDPRERESAIDRVVDESIKSLTAKDAHFRRNDVVRDACIASVELGITPEVIAARIDKALSQQEQFIALGGRDQRFTTRHIYEEIEGRAHAAADALTGRRGDTMTERAIEQAIQRSPHKLNEGQRQGVELALKGPDLILMEGPPGSGKSTMFRVVRDAIERTAGGTVIGLCPSNRAGRELESSSGMKCFTLDRFIYDQERTIADTARHHAKMLGRTAINSLGLGFNLTVSKPKKIEVDKRTTIVIDECSMCENWKLSKALQLAERVGARVVMTGDRHQLAAIGQGGLYADLFDRAKDGQKVELTEIVRQRDSWTKEAIQAARSGNLAEALQAYKDHGCLRHDARTRQEACDQLIDAWKGQGVANPKDTLIIAQTNAEVDRLNAQAQAVRREAGKLSWKHAEVASGEKIHEGDRILFTENRKDLNPLLVKSQFATVTHIDMVTRKVTVEVDGKQATLGDTLKHHATMLAKTALDEFRKTALHDSRTHSRPSATKLSNKVTFSLLDFDQMRLSYAVTTHRSQSMTLDKDAFILAGGSMQGLEMSVVQLSRAKNSSYIFTDKATVAGLEELERQMKRSQEKTTAHAIQRENELGLHLSL